MPVLRLLPWAMIAALVVFSAATYADLPAEIPRHFDAAGKVTSITPTSLVSWMMVPLIALVTQAGLAWVSALLPRHPQWFNFPEKERFLKIPAAYHAPVLARMQEVLHVTGTFTVLVFTLVQVMIWRSALGHAPGDLSLGLIVGSVMFTPGILIMTSRVNNAVDEAEKRWKAHERGTVDH